MKRTLSALVITVGFLCPASAHQTGQPGALSSQTQRLNSEVLITNLGREDLEREIAAEHGKIEHMSEVARGGPVAAVVRTSACREEGGSCKVNADLVVYRPDGSVFYEVKSMDLPRGRAAVPLAVDRQAPTGVYRVVVTVRDLAARRFAQIERQFGVK